MVIMEPDPVRDYFYFSAGYFDPADPVHTTLSIFFTRWITRFCAPALSLLARLSAFTMLISLSMRDSFEHYFHNDYRFYLSCYE